MTVTVRTLADCMMLGSLLDLLRRELGSYELLEHWQQGEFHHDVVLRVPTTESLPGAVLVVATNCNGGIKDVSCFEQVPDASGFGTCAVLITLSSSVRHQCCSRLRRHRIGLTPASCY